MLVRFNQPLSFFLFISTLNCSVFAGQTLNGCCPSVSECDGAAQHRGRSADGAGPLLTPLTQTCPNFPFGPLNSFSAGAAQLLRRNGGSFFGQHGGASVESQQTVIVKHFHRMRLCPVYLRCTRLGGRNKPMSMPVCLMCESPTVAIIFPRPLSVILAVYYSVNCHSLWWSRIMVLLS